jgi:hypothetical protein
MVQLKLLQRITNIQEHRTPHIKMELWNKTSFVCLKICEDPTLNPRDGYTNMHSKLLVKIVFVNQLSK